MPLKGKATGPHVVMTNSTTALHSLRDTANRVLNATADHGAAESISKGFMTCIDEIEKYSALYLACMSSAAGKSNDCKIGAHSYQSRMAEAKQKDTIRERLADELLKRRPKNIKISSPKLALLVLHSLYDTGEVLPNYKLYNYTTQTEVFYRLSKGHRGRRITLSQNPRLYFGFTGPYTTAAHFNLNPPDNPTKSTPSKNPEENMQRPFIVLEDTSRQRSFSLAKWDNALSSIIMLRDRGGVLYNGVDLMRLILYNDLSESVRKERMDTWSILEHWNEKSSSAERLQTMLKAFLDGAGTSAKKTYRIVVSEPATVPSPGSSHQTASHAEPTAESELQDPSEELVASPQDDPDNMSDAATEFFDCVTELAEPPGGAGLSSLPSDPAPEPLDGSNTDTAPLEPADHVINNPPEPLPTPAASEPSPAAEPDTATVPRKEKGFDSDSQPPNCNKFTAPSKIAHLIVKVLMNVKETTSGVAYELPATVKSIQSGWQSTFQSSSIISAIFVVIESVLLILLNGLDSGKFNPDRSCRKALHVMSYLAFFFSISATFCSLFLVHEFGQLHFRAAQRELEVKPLIDMVVREDA
ncbi:hypothetical protein FRC06_000704, partial [Ceratobasidium sp. 370]